LRSSEGPEYGVEDPTAEAWESHDDRKEVFAMITTVYSTTSRQADLAMPTSRCADAAWLRALPEFMGEVSVLTGDVKGHVRIATADLSTLPGTTAWSPPT
jgi:hypothetical protein